MKGGGVTFAIAHIYPAKIKNIQNEPWEKMKGFGKKESLA